jgi:hypothetical protein
VEEQEFSWQADAGLTISKGLMPLCTHTCAPEQLRLIYVCGSHVRPARA